MVSPRVGKVSYELKLPNELALVHSVFHASMLKKCVGDPESNHPIDGLGATHRKCHELE